MTTPQDTTAEALPSGPAPGRGYVIARALSQILHPIFLSLLSLLLIGLFGVAPRSSGLLWALACAALQVIPPTIFFSIRLRQGAYTDDDVSVRSQRNELYLFGFVSLLAGVILLSLMGAPLPFVAMLSAAVLINLLGWLVNLFWKISVHGASIGSTAMLATLYSEPLGLLLWLSALALGWARVRTRNHTPMQVVAGAALGAACILVAFQFFGLM